MTNRMKKDKYLILVWFSTLVILSLMTVLTKSIFLSVCLIFFVLILLIVYQKINWLPYVIIAFLPLHGFLIKFLSLENTVLIYWKEALIALFLITSVIILFQKEIEANAIIFSVLLFCIYVTAMSLLANDLTTNIHIIPIYVLYPLFFTFVVFIWEASDFKRGFKLLVFSLSLLVIGGLMEVYLPGVMENYKTVFESERFGLDRISFSVGSSLVYGPLIVILVLFLLSYFIWGGVIRYKVISLIMSFLGILAIYFSFTRISWLQLVIGVTIFFIYVLIQKKKSYLRVYLYLLFLITSFTLTISLIYKHYQFLGTSVTSRISDWEYAYQVFSSNPLTGSGIGNFTWAIATKSGTNIVAESYFLQLLSEAGLIGLILFLTPYVISIIYLLKQIIITLKTNAVDWTVMAVFASLISLFINLIGSQAINAWVLNMIYWMLIFASLKGNTIIGEKPVEDSIYNKNIS